MLPAVAEHCERDATPPAMAGFDHAEVAPITPASRVMIAYDRETVRLDRMPFAKGENADHIDHDDHAPRKIEQ